MTEKVANYRKYMPVKIPEDTSSVVRSPMPGMFIIIKNEYLVNHYMAYNFHIIQKLF